MRNDRFFNCNRLFLYPGIGVLTLVMTLGLTACESQKHTRGNLLDPDRIVDIKPGELSRDEVAEILGSPSSVTPFSSNTWYYISQQTETFAFFEPEVMERQIVAISFDKKGMVTKVDTVGLNKGMKIIPVARTTPTHGNKMTVLEQIVGNLGRFKNTNKNTAGEGQ